MRSQRFVLFALFTASMIVLGACAPIPAAGTPPWSATAAPALAASTVTPLAPDVAQEAPIATGVLTPTVSAPVVAAVEPTPVTDAPVAVLPVVPETQAITPAAAAVMEMTTYRDDVAGFEIDYPTGWSVVDVTPQGKLESVSYSVTLMSWQMQEPGGQVMPEGGSKVDINVTRDAAGTPEEAIEARRQEITAADSGSQITFEEPWELTGGLTATHWTIQPSNGELVHELVTAFNGNRVAVSGMGDPALFEQIAVTLLPVEVETGAPAAMAAKQTEQTPLLAAGAGPEAATEAVAQPLAATVYTVRQGDTLARIAARFGVSVSALLRANPQITNPDRIYVGQRINIPSAGTPPTPAGTTRVNIYMIGIGDGSVGCGDQVVAVRRDIPKTPAPLTAALNLLFSQKSQYYGESGLYNALYQSNLRIASISRSGTAWTIRLTGSLTLSGVCDNPRVKAQLEQTALQFSTVKSVRYYVNGKPLESLLSGQ